MKYFIWQDVFKRFIICFVILCTLKMLLFYFQNGNWNLPSSKLNSSFIFSIIYGILSSYLAQKAKEKNG